MALKCVNKQGIKNLMLGVLLLFSTTVFSQPTITNFSPNSGAVGTLVTITGNNLSNPTAITIGGVSAIPISNNGNTLVAMVMPGATTGGVSITTAGGTANGLGNFLVTSSQLPNMQQGNKLVGTGAMVANQGRSVSISADGNTAIVGGDLDNSRVGAAWVYTRSGGVWTQQGNKLVGIGAVGPAGQGRSVSISADGNTAIVGGPIDNEINDNGAIRAVGAAWVYSRSAGVWTQQGNKLVGTGAVGYANQGSSVSISADGNTAIVGGYYDNDGVGASWVYTRSGGVWTQQGNKLVGTGAVGPAYQGYSVSISADGNTAIVGGNEDEYPDGAAWVYTRSGGVWTQQGNKLAGTGVVGYSRAQQGSSVSISADGNTAVVGGITDNNAVGAAWVYTRSGGIWTQQGNKLVGSGVVGTANHQGGSVSLSADGNTVIVGGSLDNGSIGAAWVYKRSGGVWTQQGNKLVGTGAVGSAGQGRSVSMSADGNTAVVGGSGDNSAVGAAWVYSYLIPAPTVTSFAPVTAAAGAVISITGTNFTGTSVITLGGTPVTSFTVVSSISIVAIVGTGATGAVSLTTPGGSASLAGFIFIPPSSIPAPTITNFSPNSGPVGTLVTITGTNLSDPTAITIGGVSAIPISNNGTTLVAMVMPGATTGGVSVSNAGGTANGSGNFLVTSSQVPNTQQGNKLVGTGAAGQGYQGVSVSISADGNTAIVGGDLDNSVVGAVWVYTRSGGVWTQQGNKLVGSGAVGSARQGFSVSISADGNTAIVGGFSDNSGVGAAWVFTRSGGVWTQQGNKLVGAGAVGSASQGHSVSISADGNTAIVGGWYDNSRVGAAWVYTRSGGVWTQQGNKLVGTGAVGQGYQGVSVSICADGNTAIVGGHYDNNLFGAAWVYTRSGGVWTQQGNKLVGTGAATDAQQGVSVSISADGNTAIVGGYYDNLVSIGPGALPYGAAWVYTRSGGVWTQQGNKLAGTGAVGQAAQGYSVSISADGNTAMVGGYYDNSTVGAAWVFIRSGGVWTQLGNKLVGSGAAGSARQGSGVSISADGNTAIVGGAGDNLNIGAAWVYTYLPPPAPTITSFAPVTAAAGAIISITGTNFTGTSVITLGGTPVTSFTVVSSTSIVAIVGTGATGAVSLTTPGGSASLAGFNFIAAPTITSFTPTSAAAGAIISITGTNFNNTSAITLGGTPVTSFTVVSSTSILAIVGTGATGAVSLTTAGGTASLAGFTFISAPSITTFAPTIAAAGAIISITGTNFNNTSAITLGGTPVTSFTVVSSTSIVAIVGTGATGAVSLTTLGGSSSLAGFTYIPAPTITSFAPTNAAAGAVISITGTNFTGTTVITLGGTPVTSFTVVSSTSIVAIVGTGNTGAIRLTTSGGNAFLAGFTFISAPRITSFAPTSAAAGAIISISGTNFTGTSIITLGGTPVTSFTVVSSTSIVAIVGTGATGAVSLTTPGGSASLAGFIFIPPSSIASPTITSFAPTSAPAGAVISITGTNFTSTSIITLGGTPVTSFTVVSSTSIVAIVGTGTTGAVSLTTPGGNGSLVGFIFIPPSSIPAPTIISFAPTSAAGGAIISITGTNFTGTSIITLGGTPVTSFTVVSSTSIVVIVGTGATGAVSLTTPGGTTSLAGFTFLFSTPNINPNISNVFSPNGDGINDFWQLSFLQSYPNATVEIVNRFGQVVFFSNGYAQPWDGKFKGVYLPVGTYYYIINLKNGRDIIKGAVTIIR